MAIRNGYIRARLGAARGLAVVLLVAVAGIASAESTAPCPDGLPRTADLGIRQLDGNFTISIKKVQDDPILLRKVWRFFEEPRVSEIDPAGPSMGRLKEGDALVAIDGALITTSEAGRKIGALDPDRTVKLTVRRDGRTVDVRVRPRSRCPDENLADMYQALQDRAVRTPRPPRVPSAPSTPQAPEAPQPEWTTPYPPNPPVAPMAPERISRRLAMTRGWFGIGLNCDCQWVAVNDTMVFRANEYPTIYLVEPGSPADKGGLQRGDMLTEINGVSLLSDQGGHLFGSIKPGQAIKWTLQREGETKNAVVVAGVRPGSENMRSLEKMREDLGRMQITPEQRKQLERMSMQFELLPRVRSAPGTQKLRWSGSVGNADVTVKGVSNVQVSTDEETGEIVISTGDATIRIRKSDLKEKKGDK